MNEIATDIEILTWTDHASVMFPVNHISSLQMFRESVVRPSLSALRAKIDQVNLSDDVSYEFEHEEYAELHHETIEGFLLTTQSMFERGLRRLLVDRARLLKSKPNLINKLQCASWARVGGKDLHEYFQLSMRIALNSFDSYDDLSLLQLIGNSVRHGDGSSAQKLHDSYPSLWPNWLPPGTIIPLPDRSMKLSGDGPTHPSFESISLPENLLEQMIQSAIWFWEDIEYVRCNSFINKHPSVIEKLQLQRVARKDRHRMRVWNPI